MNPKAALTASFGPSWARLPEALRNFPPEPAFRRPSSPFLPKNLKSYFSGSWDFYRTIEDRTGSSSDKPALSTIRGIATFTPSAPFVDSKTGQMVGMVEKGSILKYHESGKAEFAGSAQKVEVRQSYFWIFPQPDLADVYFNYRSLFHSLGPPMSPNIVSDGWQPLIHPCNLDMYEGRYEIWDPHRYFVEWNVRGPDKDYTSQTVFVRRG